MKLNDWRKEKGWTYQRLADALEIDLSHAMRLVNGNRKPGPELMERIYMLTESMVAPNDFYPIDRWRTALEALWAKARGMLRDEAA